MIQPWFGKKPRYRWNSWANCWMLQGVHRLAPPQVWPSNLQPAPRYRRYFKHRQCGSAYDA